jgi:hypothetical protein
MDAVDGRQITVLQNGYPRYNHTFVLLAHQVCWSFMVRLFVVCAK